LLKRSLKLNDFGKLFWRQAGFGKKSSFKSPDIKINSLAICPMFSVPFPAIIISKARWISNLNYLFSFQNGPEDRFYQFHTLINSSQDRKLLSTSVLSGI
jgi:hypothetical protein